MGVKSTVILSRQEAEDKFVEHELALHEKKVRELVKGISNSELSKDIEVTNDKLNNGEGFENYEIEYEED